MADEKKPAEATHDFWTHPDPFVEVVWFIIMMLVGIFGLNALVRAFTSPNSSSLVGILKSIIFPNLWLLHYLQLFIIILSIVSAFCIMYLYFKLRKIRIIEKALLYPEALAITEAKNPEWERILNYTDSFNENDWKQAILEADIILSGLLDKLFLPGETMGEKLKAVEPSDFLTLDDAWEAHRIRNQIAHEGPQFAISQHEARRVIGLYRVVFEEFKII